VLCTEPLTREQLELVGWAGRQGLSDTNNQFHYYRLTHDNRIVWGGYDAVYYFNRPTDPKAFQGFGATLMAGAEVLAMIRNFDIEKTLNTYHYRPKKR